MYNFVRWKVGEDGEKMEEGSKTGGDKGDTPMAETESVCEGSMVRDWVQ